MVVHVYGSVAGVAERNRPLDTELQGKKFVIVIIITAMAGSPAMLCLSDPDHRAKTGSAFIHTYALDIAWERILGLQPWKFQVKGFWVYSFRNHI